MYAEDGRKKRKRKNGTDINEGSTLPVASTSDSSAMMNYPMQQNNHQMMQAQSGPQQQVKEYLLLLIHFCSSLSEI